VRPLQLAHLKLYLENAIELEAHRHGVFNGLASPSLQSVGVSDESVILPPFWVGTNTTYGRVVLAQEHNALSHITRDILQQCSEEFRPGPEPLGRQDMRIGR